MSAPPRSRKTVPAPAAAPTASSVLTITANEAVTEASGVEVRLLCEATTEST